MSMNEILREFLLETQENLAVLDSDLVALEKNPAGKSTLAQVFRTLHSIKGTAGFIGLVKLQAVAHSAESLLSLLRAGDLQVNPTITTALLRVVDAIRAIVGSIEASGGEGEGDYSGIIAELDLLRETGRSQPSQSTAAATLPPVTRPAVQTPAVAAAAHQSADPQLTIALAGDERPVLPPASPPPAEPPPAVSSPAPSAAAATLPPVTRPAATPAADPQLTIALASDERPALPPLSPLPAEPPRAVSSPAPSAPSASIRLNVGPTVSPATAAPPETAPRESTESRAASVADTSIRVDVGLLDKLMNLVGELVLARNQILQYSDSHDDSGFLGAVQRLNLLTTELQVGVMKTRMQPIGNVWSKFPRIVRDLALACGKKVRFEMEGQDTELDKTLIEAIRDPLTHMVRNAVDHGIETPEARTAGGKLAEGRLRMVAFHEGGKVIIEIADDGGGIDVARVRDKAINAKIVTPEDAARMSRHELLRLIFLPGFSTADRVTQFSGRGVGMDVVRTNIEKIGGTVDIESTPGQGTTIRTKIPLTLAIIPALIVVAGGERYAIPQVSLLELVWLDADQTHRGVEWMQGAPVYRLRGNLLPLVFLSEQLRLEQGAELQRDLNIVVLQADDRQFGLVVDAIRDTEEIVVKPLQKQLKGIAAFSGAAIMGDGRVALILDVLGIAQQAKVLSLAKGRGLSEKAPAAVPAASETESLLLFASSIGGQMAIPLSRVSRLEMIPRATLESVGPGQVVQYRGEILPLVDLTRELERLGPHRRGSPESQADEAAETSVVVYTHENCRVGLVVGEVLDIVNEQVSTHSRATRPGVLFTAVVQGKVTEFVDVAAILRETTTDTLQPAT